MTLLTFLTQTATIASVIESGQALAPEETTTILVLFNNLLDSLNTERLNLYSVASSQFALNAGVGAYQIGPTAAAPFNVARPTLIQSANIIYAGLALPLDMANSVQWAAITERDNVANLPTKLYYDNAFPVGTLNLNPIPKCTTPTWLELFMWTILSQYVDGDLPNDIAYPPGYMEPLQYLLAAALPDAFGLQLSQFISQKALDSKARLRGLNAQILAGPMGEASTGQIPTIGLPTQ